MTAPTHFIGRQPILTANRTIFAYELLFRESLDNSFSGPADSATRQMIDNVLVFGLDTLTPGAKAFVNCNRDALTQRLVTALPADLTVLEIPENTPIDDEVVDACCEFKRMGYRIALDHYLPGTGADRLLGLADYIKLDFRSCPAVDLRKIHTSLKRSKVEFIAEKVETDLEFKYAQAEGYQYFQGYFFSRPTILQRREVPSSHLLYLQLLSALSKNPWDQHEIERLVIAEASLCFRVLRLVNSPSFAIRTPMTSIRQALLMIGEDDFRKLVTVASATSFGKRFNTPPELILMALHRARFCELLAPIAGQLPGEQYLIGLLSVFDAILQIPTPQILQMLPLREQASEVLLSQQGSASVPYRLLHCYEQRQWTQCARLCKSLAISEAELTSIYLTALQWASNEIRNAAR